MYACDSCAAFAVNHNIIKPLNAYVNINEATWKNTKCEICGTEHVNCYWTPGLGIDEVKQTKELMNDSAKNITD